MGGDRAYMQQLTHLQKDAVIDGFRSREIDLNLKRAQREAEIRVQEEEYQERIQKPELDHVFGQLCTFLLQRKECLQAI